jgi:Holliday junction DNA helicase RuvA
VGKKTAERLVLELKDRVQGLGASEEGPSAASSSSAREDLVSALLHLGYSRPEAQRGVERALKDGAGRFEDVLRRTLRILSGR